jgi:nucleotide-binding universal stress UspA family protein
MSKTVVLAVDVARQEAAEHIAAAIEMVKDMAHAAHGARLLVLGSSSRTDLPVVPFGSVASRVLHISAIPVLIVPMRRSEMVTRAAAESAREAPITAGLS